MVTRQLAIAFALTGALAAAPRDAAAIPYFAHEYGMACQKCHSVVPRLNAFGQAFMDHGYALPGARPEPAFPLATKVNLAYSSAPDPTGLPKAIVDEVEVFLAGQAGERTNYFIEQYLVDGGRPGSTRDAWVAERLTGDGSRVAAFVQAGSFTLPLPVDPETFRETAQHYTVFDQTVGDDPFNFFDPKVGVQVRAGSSGAGLSAHVMALQGHDKQSGIPSLGIDTMTYVQDALGPLTLSAYRYDGSRPLAPIADRFWRQGYGATYVSGKWEADAVLQAGHDANASNALDVRSSGGFLQLRYEFERRLFGLVRYEGTSDSLAGTARDLVPLLGYRTARNSRVTVEDVVEHVPRTTNTLNLQFTVAY